LVILAAVKLALTVPICWKLPLMRASTMKPVSLFELSCQLRSISVLETAVACRPVGAAGVLACVSEQVRVSV
jgi:hypothetical protein